MIWGRKIIHINIIVKYGTKYVKREIQQPHTLYIFSFADQLCIITWWCCWREGLSDRVEFIPRDGRRLVAASAELETCAERCNISHATVTVKLTTEHIGKGCDRDTYSLESQRRLCGEYYSCAFSAMTVTTCRDFWCSCHVCLFCKI